MERMCTKDRARFNNGPDTRSPHRGAFGHCQDDRAHRRKILLAPDVCRHSKIRVYVRKLSRPQGIPEASGRPITRHARQNPVGTGVDRPGRPLTALLRRAFLVARHAGPFHQVGGTMPVTSRYEPRGAETAMRADHTDTDARTQSCLITGGNSQPPL